MLIKKIFLATLLFFTLLLLPFSLRIHSLQSSNIILDIHSSSVYAQVPTPTATTTVAAGPNLADRVTEGFVVTTWKAMIGMVNIILVVALFVISFSNILRINIDTYTVKKALPNLVIGVVLANASMLIIRYIIDLSTAVTYFFINQTGSATFGDFINKVIGGAVSTLAPEQWTTQSGLLRIILGLIVTVIIYWLALVMYIRLVVIYFLVGVSPLAFIAYGVPGFDKYFKMWWQWFVKWLFMLVGMVVIIWVGYQFTDNTSLIPPTSLAKILILLACLAAAAMLPFKWGGMIMEKWSKYSGADWAKRRGQQFVNDRYTNSKDRLNERWTQARGRIPGLKGLDTLKARRELTKANIQTDIATKQIEAKRRAMGKGSLFTGNISGFHRDDKTGKWVMDQETVGEKMAAAEIKKKTAESELNKLASEQKSGKRIVKDENGEYKEVESGRAGMIEKYGHGLTEAEFASEAATNQETAADGRRKFTFFESPENKKLIDLLSKTATSTKSVADALSKEKGIAEGNYARNRTFLLNTAHDVLDYRKRKDKLIREGKSPDSDEVKEIDSHIATLNKNFNEFKGGEEDLNGFEDALALGQIMDDDNNMQGKLYDAERSQVSKQSTKSFEAQSEVDRQEWTAANVPEGFEKTIDKLGGGEAGKANLRLIMEGKSGLIPELKNKAGATLTGNSRTKVINDAISMNVTTKQLLNESRINPARQEAALAEIVKLHADPTSKEFTFKARQRVDDGSGTRKKITIMADKTIKAEDIPTLEMADKQALVSHIQRTMGGFSGTVGDHLGGVGNPNEIK